MAMRQDAAMRDTVGLSKPSFDDCAALQLAVSQRPNGAMLVQFASSPLALPFEDRQLLIAALVLSPLVILAQARN